MPRSNMRDVANHAGVSVATVSHVINNTRFVAEDTRQRVLESIKQLDYSPDAMARIFKTGRKNLIGFIVPDIANSFFSTIIEEVESVLDKQNFKLIVSNTKESRHREIENIRVLASGIVDGLIVASTLENYSQIARLVAKDLPLVFIDRTLPACPCDTITISNYQSVYRGVEQLIQRGHQKIGYITGLPRLSTTIERLAAYTNAMKDYHLCDDALIRFGDSMSKSSILQLGELLKMGCTALVVSNNVMADDVLFHLDERGIKIGRDIDMLGYCDTEQSRYNLRKISVVSQPSIELGRLAGQQILERIAQPLLPVKQIVLQSSFLPWEKNDEEGEER